MKKLLSSTALVLALGLPIMALAEAAPQGADSATQTHGNDTQGFMDQRGASDVLASELMGHDVLAHRAPTDGSPAENRAGPETAGQRDRAVMSRADIENMDNIGQINDLVLSHDGQVRAIVIGVGGFLGMGERDVALTMDQVTIAFDQDDQSQMHVVANIDADRLEQSPPYDSTTMAGDRTRAQDGSPAAGSAATTQRSMDATPETAAERERLTRPEMTRGGFDRVEATRVSTELLMGATVHDVDDNSVGTVDELVFDDAGTISNVIIDFGGFLGLGSSQVSLEYDELTILSNDSTTELRIYVDATKAQIQNLPQYQAMN